MGYSRSIDPSIMLWAPFDGKPSLESEIGPTFAITRATQGSYRDNEGIIRFAPHEKARFQGSKRELNAFTYSDDLVGAAWTNIRNDVTRSLINPPRVLGPTVPVHRVNDDNGGGAGSIYHLQTFDLLSDGTYTWQVYVKPGDQEGTGYFIQTNAFGGANATTDFEYTTNLIDLGAGHDDAGIVALEDGWYKLWVTFTLDLADTGGQIYMGPGEDFTISLNRDGSHEHWVCAPQVYQGPYNENQAYYGTGASIYDEQVYSPGDSNEPPRGLCVEEARTNIALQSEAFATTWATARASVSSNAVASPAGAVAADKLVLDATAANSHYLTQTVTVATATAYTFSVFAKAGELTWLALGTNAFTTPINDVSYFNLGTGALGTVSGNHDDAAIEDYGNGWHRCSITFTTDAVDTIGDIRIFLAEGDGDFTIDGDGTSGVYLWGAQMEAGSNPASYIPTTIATQTRNNELVQTTDTTWATWDENVGLTLCSKAQMLHEMQDNVDALNVFYLRGSDDGTTRYSHLCQSTLNPQLYSTTTGGASDMAITLGTNDYGDFFPTKAPVYHASGIAQNDVYTVQAGTSGTDTGHDCWDSSVYTDLTLGATPGLGENQTALIQELLFFDERKDNNFLDDYSNGLVSALQVSPSVNQLKGMHLSSLPTSTDARWHEIINSSGITKSGDFIDDCHAALESLTGDTGDLATLYKKYARQYVMWDSETLRSAGGVSPNRDFEEAWNFEAYPTLTGIKGTELSHTRATTATVVDEDGYIRTVQSGEARFQGSKFRHNLLTYSNLAFSGWVDNRSVTTEVGIPPPLGLGGPVVELRDNNAGGANSSNVYQNPVTYKQGGQYLQSFYVKAGSISWVILNCSNVGAINPRTYFNVDPTAYHVGVSADIDDAGIEDIGDGWFRIWMTYTNTTTDTTGTPSVGLAEGDSDQILPLDGTNYVYIYGPQLEDVSGRTNPTPSPLINTVAAQVTEFSESGDGLLMEEARTNLVLQSEDITTTWNAGQATPVANATTAPDGAASADKLIDDALGGAAQIYVGQAITGAISTSYTLSLFAKQDQVDHVLIQVADQPGAIYRIFDLTDGSLGTTNTGTHTAGIEDYGNGWYRCWLQFTTGAADNTFEYRIAAYDGDTVAAQDRDGTTSIFVWGIQCEAGAFATSYIPTTTGSVTRNGDIVETTDVSWFNSSEGTFYVETEKSYPVPSATSDYVFEMSDSSSSDRMAFYLTPDGDAAYFQSSNSVTVVLLDDNNALHLLGEVRQAMAYAVDDVELYNNGTRSGTGDQSAAVSIGINKLHMGNDYDDVDQINGLIKVVAYYPERMDNTFLERASNGSLIIK